ncbi:HD domain protein [Bacteriovorax sp. BAL6_X]|uniref:HD domain-containing phosphohydrolase n=1 Tax=Bacteriovorax sp. BAL6_X TaxID=1201290 RepID=UPI0003856E1A|nr:HD domain-containing phosphohydrolase [Bacteriovorax sp. BAL6_X]EPZ51262.1 HD domain protein [Bacteriovorax sp. BAL6_X]
MRAYFFIKLSSLRDIKTFAFSLYIYNLKDKTYNLSLKANTPLTKDSYELLRYIEESKKGKIAVKLSQRMTYLATVGELEKIESKVIEKTKQKIEVLKEYENIIEEQRISEHIALPPLRSMVSKAIDKDDFLPIILRAQKEIMLFSIDIGHTVSLARHFAGVHLNKDNLTNRIVSLSYFFAKKLMIDKPSDLADLVCASFLANIGLTQISPNIIHGNHTEITADQREQYYKHVKFSRMFIEQSGIELSDTCKKLIDTHHEKYDGTGMPDQISQAGLNLSSEILEFISHIMEFSDGLITGEKTSLSSVVYMIDAGAGVNGLNINYSGRIRPHITSVLNL